MKLRLQILLIPILFIAMSISLYGQDKMELTLEKTIELAQEQSLSAFINENLYLSSWWEYRAYQAKRRPWLVFDSNPFSYSNSIKVTDNNNVYSLQRSESLISSGVLSLKQEIAQTGGVISLYSKLNGVVDYSNNDSVTYGYNPISISVAQPLFQYNKLKWEKKIEPLKFEIAKKEYIKSAEEVAINAINYFFNFLDAQQDLKIAELNKVSADSLYYKSLGRYELGAISFTDLQRLELNMLNSKTSFETSRLIFDRREFNLKSFLRLPEDQEIKLIVPDSVSDLKIAPRVALNKALANNPSILVHKQALIEADRDIAKVKGDNGIHSSVDFNFGWSKSGNKIDEIVNDFNRDRGVSLSLYVPIVDWGMRRGKIQMANSNKKITVASVEIERIKFEQNVLMSAREFNMLESQLYKAQKANTISENTYETVEESFLLGKVDLETLYAARKERDSALRSYFGKIREYWDYYYYLRSITLYDFESDKSLAENFDEFFRF